MRPTTWGLVAQGSGQLRILPAGKSTWQRVHAVRGDNDHPLFGINASMERKNGDFVLFWGEYLVVVPPVGPARRLDLRSHLKIRAELAGVVLYVPEPEGFWIGHEAGRALDFAYLSFADFEKRAIALP